MQNSRIFSDRIFQARGQNAFELGKNMGRLLGERLGEAIQAYFDARLVRQADWDQNTFQAAALAYLSQLPPRFRDELEGLAAGAGLPLSKLAEWVYLDPYLESGCTGAICLISGQAWVARNNDIFSPHLWGYASVREIYNRIPTMTFGLLGDVFTPTGVNREGLWLHYNFLAAWDAPRPGRLSMPPYAFIVEALETCTSLQEVENLLASIDRDGAMLLFALDGQTEDFALYECSCGSHIRRGLDGDCLVGANHFTEWEDPRQDENYPAGSIARQNRMEALLQEIYLKGNAPQLPAALIRILADEQIEGRDPGYGTVYACVACPGARQVWYTLGGYPAASQGRWAKVDWPW